MPTRRSVLAAGLITLTISGCTSPDRVLTPESSRSARPNANLLTLPASRRSHREQLAELARQAPGFAGVYLDEAGVPTIAVATDRFDSAGAKAVLDWVHNFAPSTRGQSRVKFRRVNYAYDTLYASFTLIQNRLWNGDRVTAMGINERTGKIDMSAETQAAIAVLRVRFAEWGIPSDMVSFEQRGPAIAQTTLNQIRRPTIGALMITEHNGHECTIGFNVYNWNTGIGGSSPKYFLTAGHCSGTWGDTARGWPYYQPASPSRIGEEFATATVHSTGYCPTGHSPCMEADALAVRYDDTVSVSYGVVANVDASRNIITPLFGVTGNSGGLLNQTVTMVGQVSGKSTATIRAVCVDQDVTNVAYTYWIKCQSSADYTAAGGDSGAPVFIPFQSGNSQTPRLVGIHSSTDQNGHKWYTPINQIDIAFGSIFYYQ